MSTFNRVKRYRTPLVEIDQKIKDLDDAMNTTGYYTQVDQNSEQEFITMSSAPLGTVIVDDFVWTDQGDDSKNRKVNTFDPNKKSAARFFRKPKPKTKDQVREERLEELRHLENTLSNK
tara:strand:- start:4389 stop:4745 length:357 start_codon:yes stop_codon:yes gene_type:complete